MQITRINKLDKAAKQSLLEPQYGAWVRGAALPSVLTLLTIAASTLAYLADRSIIEVGLLTWLGMAFTAAVVWRSRPAGTTMTRLGLVRTDELEELRRGNQPNPESR